MNHTIPIIDPHEVNTLVNQADAQYLLVDVRQTDEFYGELGHIKNAKLVTLGPTLTQFLSESNRQQQIIFICRSGMRSKTATLEALNLGYQQVFNMTGGMIAWNELNFPVEKK